MDSGRLVTDGNSIKLIKEADCLVMKLECGLGIDDSVSQNSDANLVRQVRALEISLNTGYSYIIQSRRRRKMSRMISIQI